MHSVDQLNGLHVYRSNLNVVGLRSSCSLRLISSQSGYLQCSWQLRVKQAHTSSSTLPLLAAYEAIYMVPIRVGDMLFAGLPNP